jgi:hypothetical protein
MLRISQTKKFAEQSAIREDETEGIRATIEPVATQKIIAFMAASVYEVPAVGGASLDLQGSRQ